jgi:hypothetical protein
VALMKIIKAILAGVVASAALGTPGAPALAQA